MHRPPQVLILQLSGHQTQMVGRINLLQLCACAAVSGVGMVGYLELVMNVAVGLCATTKIRKRVLVNCQDMSQSVQCRDKSRITYQSLQRVLQVYAPYGGAKRGITQWVGDRSQEDKLDCYCDYCRVYIQ